MRPEEQNLYDNVSEVKQCEHCKIGSTNGGVCGTMQRETVARRNFLGKKFYIRTKIKTGMLVGTILRFD